MDQLSFNDGDIEKAASTFDGGTYQSEFDQERLGRQALAVYALMRDGQWRSLAEVAAATGAPEASVSARLRDFRKERWGRHVMERRRRDGKGGTWEYRLLPPRNAADDKQEEEAA